MGRVVAAGAPAARGTGAPRPLRRLFALALLARGVCGGVNKDAVAHVQCQVCRQAVSEAVDYARDNAIKDEDGLADMVEGLCSSKKKEGRWVARYDIVRKGADAQLEIERQDGLGFCNSECLIIIRACEASLKGQDDALTSLLLAGKDANAIRKKTCKKACDKKKKLPKLSSWTDETWDPRDEKELETEDMIAKMKAETGMGMKMYKREDMLSMSEGDMEAMAAREALAQERAAERMRNQDEM